MFFTSTHSNGVSFFHTEMFDRKGCWLCPLVSKSLVYYPMYRIIISFLLFSSHQTPKFHTVHCRNFVVFPSPRSHSLLQNVDKWYPISIFASLTSSLNMLITMKCRLVELQVLFRRYKSTVIMTTENHIQPLIMHSFK